eukprot:XP_017173510.1 PREDICTED: protein NYNRIN-like isoform X2 [Mus musculus]
MADQAAREAAMGTDTKASSLLIETSTPYTPDFFHYTETDIKNLQELGATYDREKKYWVLQGKPVMPDQFTFELLDFLHQLTHLSYQKMRALLDRKESPYYMLNKDKILHEVAESCQACVQVNASKTKIRAGTRVRGHRPGTHWEIDFTKVKPGLYGYKYLLVFVDTFSGWVEAFPTKHETAKIVTKKLLEEIFPRFGMPQVLGTDNGPAFVSQLTYRPSKQYNERSGSHWPLPIRTSWTSQ